MQNEIKPSGLPKRKANSYAKRTQKVIELREDYSNLSARGIEAKLSSVKKQLQRDLSVKERENLQAETFALSSLISTRLLGQTPYPVQILGGLVIADGAIAEMATGEGKTLTAVAPVVWWALHAQGVHVATANEYLAERDAEELRPVYEALGLSVAYTHRDHTLEERKREYNADITYGTAQTFGFDYLTDNLAHDPEDIVRRGAFAAIVDEADSLLIDEARTPLIISATNPQSGGGWEPFAAFVASLDKEDYEEDKSENYVLLTDSGADRAEAFFSLEKLYDHPQYVQRILTALKAEVLFTKDKEYIVRNNEVVIVDENTGRIMPGRRFQDGIHEAIEAKEGLKTQAPTVTMASATLQSFFGMYEHLGGMTGTALTDAEELYSTYGTEVVGIPTHRPRIRQDQADVLFGDTSAKYSKLIEKIIGLQKEGRPVLVGSSSVEESEELSRQLKDLNINHNVLNARSDASESAVIAEAGAPGAVTISTSMAGRGVDIKLGGDNSNLNEEELQAWQERNAQVKEAGGLVVLSTSRGPSRRVDNQLRGRSGRQGEPGQTQFFLAGDDELVRVFGGSQVGTMLSSLSSSGEAFSHGALSKIIDKAQLKIEEMHAESRKSLIEFDGVYTAQRKAFYSFRTDLLMMSFDEFLEDFVPRAYQGFTQRALKSNKYSSLNLDQLNKALGLAFPPVFEDKPSSETELTKRMIASASAAFKEKFTPLEASGAGSEELKTTIMRRIIMDMVDQFWTSHLSKMENLQGSSSLRRYAQVDPKIAFAQEAKVLYANFMESFFETAMVTFWKVNLALKPQEPVKEAGNETSKESKEDSASSKESAPAEEATPIEED